MSKNEFASKIKEKARELSELIDNAKEYGLDVEIETGKTFTGGKKHHFVLLIKEVRLFASIEI